VNLNIHKASESGANLAPLATGADVEGVSGVYFEGGHEIKVVWIVTMWRSRRSFGSGRSRISRCQTRRGCWALIRAVVAETAVIFVCILLRGVFDLLQVS